MQKITMSKITEDARKLAEKYHEGEKYRKGLKILLGGLIDGK